MPARQTARKNHPQISFAECQSRSLTPRQSTLRTSSALPPSQQSACSHRRRLAWSSKSQQTNCPAQPAASPHHQKYIEDKKRDRNVVEERRLRQIRPELVRRPEQKCAASMIAFTISIACRPMRNLVHQGRPARSWPAKTPPESHGSRQETATEKRPGQAARATPASVTDAENQRKKPAGRSRRMLIAIIARASKRNP